MPAHALPRDPLPARSTEAPRPPWQNVHSTPRSAARAKPSENRRNAEWRARLESRVRAEFSEMPGMHLSLIQAQRLFGLRRDICERILEGLVEDGFLCNAGCAVYARRELW